MLLAALTLRLRLVRPPIRHLCLHFLLRLLCLCLSSLQPPPTLVVKVLVRANRVHRQLAKATPVRREMALRLLTLEIGPHLVKQEREPSLPSSLLRETRLSGHCS